MTITYTTLGGEVTITPSGKIPAGELNNTVSLVGYHDSANADASVTTGEATAVSTPTEAENTFGANSELARQATLAFKNGATTVYGVPLERTDQTESFAASATGTVSTTPIADPRVTTATITVTDTVAASDLTVRIVDDTPTQPSDADTVEINVRTGEWAADASSDYDISYTSVSAGNALTAGANAAPRALGVCLESDSAASALDSELRQQATDWNLLRGVIGSTPNIAPGDVGTYTPATDDMRVVEVAPARGDDGDGAVRTVGAITGLIADQPIDVTGSITYDSVAGFAGLGVAYAPSTAQKFERVTAITEGERVADGVTTSTANAFADIYATEIIDLVVERLYDRVRNYRGGSNAQGARRRFRSRLNRTLSAVSVPNAQPPLLASGDGNRPYDVTVTQGSTEGEAVADIGIDPAPIAKTVKLNVDVGTVQFGGVSAE